MKDEDPDEILDACAAREPGKRDDIASLLASAGSRLTWLERQVLTLRAQGWRYRQIGGTVGTSEDAACVHASNARRKLAAMLGVRKAA